MHAHTEDLDLNLTRLICLLFSYFSSSHKINRVCRHSNRPTYTEQNSYCNTCKHRPSFMPAFVCFILAFSAYPHMQTKLFLPLMFSGHQDGHGGVMWRGSMEPSGLRDWSSAFIFQGLVWNTRPAQVSRKTERKKGRDRWGREEEKKTDRAETQKEV